MLRPTYLLVSFLLAGVCASPVFLKTRGDNSTQKETEVEIFRKALSIGDLVVIRGLDRPASEVSRIYPTRVSVEDYTNCFEIRVEVHLERVAPVTLAVFLKRDTKMQGGYEVLDALFENGTFVIATAENGSVIVTRILPTQHVPIFSSELPQTLWTRAAAVVRIDHTIVKAKLGCTTDKLVEVGVDDLRPNLKQHTRFVQKPDKWEFQKVVEKRNNSPLK
jgi:hypothetical protein